MLDILWRGMGAFGPQYFVDGWKGSDRNQGTTMDEAFKTVQKAIDITNAQIDWSHHGDRVKPTIWIAPGCYAESLTPAYQCRMIGLGTLGTDTATEIHPASGSAMAGTFLGLELRNIRFEAETAVPVIDIDIANNSIIEGCEIVKGIAGLATVGISMENATHMQIVNNRIISGVANFATGIEFDHGATATADKFAHACFVARNLIFAATTGILIDVHNVASLCVLQENVIARPTKGIDDNNGNTYCIGNWITATSDAIEHANSATQCIGNHVINNASGAVEASGTD